MKNYLNVTTIKDFTFAVVILTLALVWAGFMVASANTGTTTPEQAPAVTNVQESVQGNVSGLVPEKNFIGTQTTKVGMIP